MHILFAALIALATPAPSPPPAIVALTQTFLDAANSNDATKFAGMFTSDAVVVDEDAPFTWSGPNAGVAWWKAVQQLIASHKAGLRVTGDPFSEYRQAGDTAYAIQPLHIAHIVAGITRVQLGTETFTFRNVRGAWKISSATWTTRP